MATWGAALLSLVLVIAALGCGPTLRGAVLNAAHAYRNDDLRLECGPAEMEVTPFRTQSRLLTAEGYARYSREGSIYSVWCRTDMRCCPHSDHGGGDVVVFCTKEGSCEVVASSVSDCSFPECPPY